MRPLLLVSNDDGHASAGIRALRAALVPLGDVVVVAPETEQSAMSHSLTLHRPLRARRVEDGVFAVDGTPADCVYLALHAAEAFLPRRPDLVVSGLNHGLNLGQDAFYSGTVAAAREGALRGIPALATSAEGGADLDRATALARRVAEALLAVGPRAAGRVYSLNVPRTFHGELRATRLGSRLYEDRVDARKDPRGREYFWLGGGDVKHERWRGMGGTGDHLAPTDTDAHDDGAASLTPLKLDLTDFGADDGTAALVAPITG